METRELPVNPWPGMIFIGLGLLESSAGPQTKMRSRYGICIYLGGGESP